ncbi:MAG TPA: hypothetical protein VHW00_09505 [Thermoanaerobaculia bacterium]|nr:hypothetical protein [Thermoanaerobaculia bacterium]
MQILRLVGINLAVFALFLLALIASNTVTGNVQNWPANSIGAVVISVLALLLALRLNARWVAPVMMVILGYTATGLIISSVFGHAAAQGAATHFAVLLAASLGVAFGWYFFSKRHLLPPAV